jgi:lipopolysaccharide transport system permease protein
VVLVGLMLYYGTSPTWQLVLVPVFIVLSAMLAAALGILFSALNVKFRDVKFALPFLLQVWMIASPIFYPLTLLSDKWKLIFAINPLTGILEGLRSALFGTALDWQVIGVSAASLLVLFATSLFVFKWMEDEFADLI